MTSKDKFGRCSDCGLKDYHGEGCSYFSRFKAKLADFGGDTVIAAEYSDVKTCPESDLGYHCSCYDENNGECCLCEQKNEAA
jgi:hypothetical protein